jgi:hypothetical protein
MSPWEGFMRKRAVVLFAAAGLGTALVPFAPAGAAPALTPAPTCTAGECTVSFALTGAPQTFTVPEGVTSLTATVAGASGGDGPQFIPAVARRGATTSPQAAQGASVGGAGGSITATVPVTGGEQLTVVVGGRGADSATFDPAAGGYGGGGSVATFDGPVGGGGGGGSFLFHGTTALVVAGGGGGASYGIGDDGGNGGSDGAGSAGLPDSTAGGGGGGGATTGAGGAGGTNCGTAGGGPASGPTTFGVGGDSACGGGAGGGGYYGGGSGGETTQYGRGGGGGGSGFLAAGVTAVGPGTTNLGDGRVVLSYAEPAPALPTTTTLSVHPASVEVGGAATLTAKVSAATGTPIGKVTFSRAGTVIGSGTLDHGTATLSIHAGQHAGTETFTAHYVGSPGYSASTSGPAVLVVTAARTPTPTPTSSVPTHGPSPSPTRTDEPLANTGAGDIGLLTTLGLVLLGAGGASLLIGRRRAH